MEPIVLAWLAGAASGLTVGASLVTLAWWIL